MGTALIQRNNESAVPSLYEIAGLVKADWRRAAAFTGLTALLALLITFVMPYWYRADATFAVEATAAPSSSTVLGLASQLGITGLPGGALSVSYYQQILTSDRVLDRVALGRVSLDSVGNNSWMFSRAREAVSPLDRFNARKRLQDNFGSATNARANTVSFWVEGRTPDAARAAAETILVALNEIILEMRRHRASAERAFLEMRLDTAGLREAALEDSLRVFYLANRIINTPNLQFKEARLKRKVDFALELASQLRSQVEQAKLQEVHDTPVLTLISPPDVPGKRSRPNRRFIVIVAILASILVYGLWATIQLVRRTAVPHVGSSPT